MSKSQKKNGNNLSNSNVGKKRYFEIVAEGNGGEFIVGKVSEEFMAYWIDREDEVLNQLDDPDYDQNSPPTFDDDTNAGAFSETDDLEHICSINEDCELSVQEVDEKGNCIGNKENFEQIRSLYDRESGFVSSEDYEGDGIPAVVIFLSEKGIFWKLIVETDGEDFNPENLHIGYAETPFCTLIDQVWYARKPIDLDQDIYSTTGTSRNCVVGYLCEHDNICNYRQMGKEMPVLIKELYEEMDEMYDED